MYTTLNNANTEIRGGRFRQTGMTGGNIIVGAVLVSSWQRTVDCGYTILYFVLVTKNPRSLYKKREYYLESIYSKNHYNTIGQRSTLRNWPRRTENHINKYQHREWVMHKHQNQSEVHNTVWPKCNTIWFVVDDSGARYYLLVPIKQFLTTDEIT